MLPGTVTKVGEGSGGAGLMVEVNAGGGYTYDYMHLTTAFVYKGEQLTADTMVGLTGTSGNAANLLPSEAHLHLQINEQIGIKKRPTDPFNFMGNPCPHGVVNFVRTGGGGSGWFGGPSWWQQWALYQAGNLALTFAEEQSQTNEPKGSASSKITGWWPLE
jgi:murein DD-endopeptidase MepM/ murein hydrolase activator NlpD